MSIIKQLRADGNRTPIIILSALGDVDKRVEGIRAGADDFLPKPFMIVELVARIEGLLRRSGASAATNRKIFINYRRKDDPGSAGRLFDRLEGAFAPEQLFFDVDSIEPGSDFVVVLNQQVASYDVVLSVIGPRWIELLDTKDWRHPEKTNDFVRIEIEAAIKQNKRIVPVLVSGAEMPRDFDLPTSISTFSRCNAVRLTHERFGADCDGLIKALNGILKDAETIRALQVSSDDLQSKRKDVDFSS